MSNNDEKVTVIHEGPLIALLQLPDGCTPGSLEAAEAFAEIISTLKENNSGKDFQLIPFSFDTPSDGTDPALKAILAVSS